MIPFRFHVIAVCTLCAAIAAGTLVGTAVAQARAQRARADEAVAAAARTRDLLDAAQAGTADAGRLADDLASAVVANRLRGVPVLELVAPGGADYVDGVDHMLALAGANIAGQIVLSPAFVDPAQNRQLLQLAEAALPPSVPAGLPVTTDGVVASTALLAAVLLHSNATRTAGGGAAVSAGNDSGSAVNPDDQRSVLVAYSGLGFLSVARPVSAAATAVVLVTGPGLPATVVDRLAAAAWVVVAATGPAAVPGPATWPPAAVSTVDDVATPRGQLVTAWALADLVAGHPGAYGATALPAT
jgi:hypothetical protein